jgi:CHAT domain-containing protein/tetratricopeptide (TPR) repeat protein
VRRAAALALLVSGIGASAPQAVRAQVEGHGRHTAALAASSPSASIDTSIDRAFALIDDRQPTRAETLLLPITCRPDLTDRQRARSERALGLAYVELNRRSHAAEAFERAIDAASAAGERNEAGWARRWAGWLHYGDGRPDAAMKLWEASLDDFVASGDRLGEFEVLDDIAMRLSGLERRPYLDRCLAIARQRHDPLLEARARARWGGGLLDAGLPGAALVELQQAVATMKPYGRKADPHYGDALAALGWALRSHGAFAEAIPIHREAIAIAQSRGDSDSLVWNYQGLGISLAQLGRNVEAQQAMTDGLRAALRTNIATNVRLLSESVGWAAMRRGHWQHAVDLLEASRSMPGVETSVLPLIYLSRAYRALHRLDESADRAALAVATAKRLGLVDGEIDALIESAHTAVAQQHLDEAERTLADVTTRLETYRANLAPVDFLKRGFADRFGDAYGLTVALMMRRDRPRDALTAAERARSRAFADLLATRRARESEEADAGRWLLGAGGTLGTTRNPSSDSPRVVPSLDADALVGLAARLSTTLVIYWTHPMGSYAWVVARDGAVHGVAIPDGVTRMRRLVEKAVDVAPALELSRAASGAVTAKVPSREAYRVLYTTLWAPVAQFLPAAPDARVTIIPHGPLLSLPFAALLDARGHYLVERYALHYATSGAVLLEASERTTQPSQEGAKDLLVADPSPTPIADSGTSLPALPGARAEVEAIARVLKEPAETLVGRAASELAVRAALPRARVVHFATHALVRDTDPLGSHLLLAAPAKADTNAEDDGRLTASEIADLGLTSDLVVLGSCRSARGPISSDGIAGLTRAFMAAGTPSVIATLWDISDIPTSRLMTRFYREYAAGVSKDQALRAAQLSLIRDLRAGRVKGTIGGMALTYPEHPWLWAAPILVGAP